MSRPEPSTSRPDAPGGDDRRRPVVVCLDGSGFAEVALPTGVDLARRLDAPLLLLCVAVEPPRPMDFAAEPTPDAYEAVLAKARADTGGLERKILEGYLETHVARLRGQGIDCQSHVIVGDPASVIVDQSVVWDARMVVLATHGRSGLMRWLLGSVAERVIRSASVPVLVVPCRSAEDPAHLVGPRADAGPPI